MGRKVANGAVLKTARKDPSFIKQVVRASLSTETGAAGGVGSVIAIEVTATGRALHVGGGGGNSWQC